MNKREEKLLKIVGCISLLINNSAYLQQYALAKLENPTVNKGNLEGIHKYNKITMKELDGLIKNIEY